MNIKYIKDNNTINSTSAFKLKLAKVISNNAEEEKDIIIFKVGDKVKHKLENIVGSITFICDDYTSIKWSDNSKEKFTKIEMNKYIQLNNEEEIIENIVEEVKEEPKIDIEKLQLQRKVDQLEKKNKDQLINKVKTKAASEIVELAISKGIIDEDDREIELQTLAMMNDEEYEKYCQDVIEFTNEHQVTSRVEERDDRTEAEKMLDKIKGTGGIIGDFSNAGSGMQASSFSGASANSGSRNLSDLNDSKITFNNQYVMPSFEEQFSDILSSELNRVENKQVTASNKLEEKSNLGFKNLQGLTKPIQIPNSETGLKMDYNSFFKSLDWSINK